MGQVLHGSATTTEAVAALLRCEAGERLLDGSPQVGDGAGCPGPEQALELCEGHLD